MLRILPKGRLDMDDRDNNQPVLSFEFLEDVMALPRQASERLISEAEIFRIGPLVEYAYHEWKSVSERLASKRHCPAVNCLAEIVTTPGLSPLPLLSALEASTFVEFSWTPQTEEQTIDPRWIAFCKRLMDAGIKAGLTKKFSQGLVGTVEEMTCNIFEHSENVSSGLAGYRWAPGEFEYVVADSGIGVLSSLRKHSDYSWLDDAGQALEVAVCDGESRFGRGAHRGTGFHHLLYNIASRDSYVRFRSGDHCYTIDGTLQPILKRTYPCPPIDGFLISLVATAAPSKNKSLTLLC